jgi:hypothetical protein
MATTSYTVVADAVNVVSGDRNVHTNKPDVARVLFGGTINGEPDDPRIVDLLASRAIRETSKIDSADTLTKSRLTAMGLYRLGRTAQIASESANVVSDVAPLNASVEQVKAHEDGE